MKLITILIRKPMNYKDIIESEKVLIRQFNAQPEAIDISNTVELSHIQFEHFKNDLLKDRDFIKKQYGIFLVKEKGADDLDGIIVHACGFSYARYAGRPMKKDEYKKCPRCGIYYVGFPAISRKDNKTEICSNCGVSEAIEDFYERRE